MAGSVSKAFKWSAVEQFGKQGLRFVLSIVLARLLSPSEYGLMGMLLVFLMIAQVFADSGLSAALVQRKEICQDDETSVFYLNVAAGLVFAGLLCAISPVVAAFYHQPLLRPMLCVCSIGVFVSSLSIVQGALLTRDVDFATLAKVSLLATIVSGVVGVAMAWKGFGVWSLVGQSIAQSVASVVLIWLLRPWRPRGRFSLARIRSMWHFSSRLLASGLLNTICESSYALVIGKLYRPADLGFYTRASNLAMLPATSVQSMTGRVMMPIFARMQDDKAQMKREMRRTLRTLLGVFFPAMAGMAAVARPFVVCLLTAKWLPCVPYLRILCFAGMLYPLHAMQLDVLTAQGRSDLFLRLEVVKKVLTVSLVAATFWLSVGALVGAVLANSVICLAINTYYTRKLISYTVKEQAGDLVPVVAASLGMASAVFIADILLRKLAPWPLLAAEVAAGSVLYAVIVARFRKSAFADLWRQTARMWQWLAAAAVMPGAYMAPSASNPIE